jgi:hypothetical protein
MKYYYYFTALVLLLLLFLFFFLKNFSSGYDSSTPPFDLNISFTLPSSGNSGDEFNSMTIGVTETDSPGTPPPGTEQVQAYDITEAVGETVTRTFTVSGYSYDTPYTFGLYLTTSSSDKNTKPYIRQFSISPPSLNSSIPTPLFGEEDNTFSFPDINFSIQEISF